MELTWSVVELSVVELRWSVISDGVEVVGDQ